MYLNDYRTFMANATPQESWGIVKALGEDGTTGGNEKGDGCDLAQRFLAVPWTMCLSLTTMDIPV
jgi:hypothetical protein